MRSLLVRTLLVSALSVAIIAFLAEGVRAADRSDNGLTFAKHGMVVSVSQPASQAGLAVLVQGGNAVDAAVATALALAVTYPEAGNIGGGGFMLLKPSGEDEPICIDYRESAPAAASAKMFAGKASRVGHRVVGVPGTLRGLALAHEMHGKLPWKDLVAPAIQLARQGFAIDDCVAASLNKVLADARGMDEFKRVFGKPGGSLWEGGDTLIQPDLASTLEQIAAEGPKPFYEGPIAQRIVAEIKSGGGLITLQDLLAYEAQVREPIHGVYRGYDIYAPPPPSSGGITLVEILNILEPLELRDMGRWSPPAVHLMAEAMRRAYCDRAKYLGDPDFVSIPLHLTSKQYARQIGRQINVSRATPSHLICRDLKLYDEKLQLYDDSTSTTHFCVIDSKGMAISNTYTLEQKYGSRVVVRGAGFLLNNEMADFNWRPGQTDRSGGIGTAANQIAPGKRMLSSQTPVMVSRNGELLLLTGSPGGREIVNTVACVLLNILEFEMDLRPAIDAPRIHHQWFPDRLQFEGYGLDLYSSTVRGLQLMGHSLKAPAETQGAAHSILVRKEGFFGAADRRITGSAAGY